MSPFLVGINIRAIFIIKFHEEKNYMGNPVNPDFGDLTFTPISANTATAIYKGKPVEVRCKILNDGNKQPKIKFEDGSRIKYITFSNDGEMKINGEEYEMPAGTIVEIKSVNDRVFSQLIQTPEMQRQIINKPEYLDNAEQVLTTYNPFQSSDSEM